MPDTPEPIKPAIDDQYWFDYSKKRIDSASSSRNDAAAKLQTLIVWLWGIYTAGAAVGMSLAKASYHFLTIVIIALPSLLLIAAYWIAMWVQMPISAAFDPRIPEDIKSAYLEDVNSKSWRLHIAIFLSFLAALLVALALIVASFTKQLGQTSLEAYFGEGRKWNNIAVAGQFPPETNLLIGVKTYFEKGDSSRWVEQRYATASSGELHTDLVFDTAGQKFDVSARWQEKEGVTRSITRSMVRPQSSKGSDKSRPG